VQSPDNTLIGNSQSITDAYGNIWTITASGQVAVNGILDTSTADVTHLAYANGLVWQENTSDLWWSKSAPTSSWDPPYGTAAVPVPVTASANETLLTASGGNASSSITDASGNTWTIVNGQVVVNGAADATTANVTHLAYVDGVIWQENSNDLWWSKSAPADAWGPPAGTSTVPVTVFASQDDTVLGAPRAGSLSAITDASGDKWTIANGQVVVNGTVDSTTANVIQLAYVNGQVWQENSQGLWWYKATPADGWGGGYGIGTSPIGTTFYVGNNPSDQATIYVGKVTVVEPTTPPNALTEIVTTGFEANGSPVGLSASGGKIVVDGDSSLTNGATLTLVGAYRAPGPFYSMVENDGAMTVSASTANLGPLSGSGSITATNGSTLNIQNSTAGNVIHLESSHLTIGGQEGFGAGNGPAGGMSFLTPITMDDSPNSAIRLANTQATSMVLQETGGSISEAFLYNGSTEVADLKLSGMSNLYAEQGMTGSTPFITLQTTATGHDLPSTVTHVS
jgi:ribosome-associated protein YbcJ (S4-like RNA binding protein)